MTGTKKKLQSKIRNQVTSALIKVLGLATSYQLIEEVDWTGHQEVTVTNSATHNLAA